MALNKIFRSRERKSRHKRRKRRSSSSGSSDRAVDIYSKMLSKQKKGPRGDEAQKRAEEQAEMERLRQIRHRLKTGFFSRTV